MKFQSRWNLVSSVPTFSLFSVGHALSTAPKLSEATWTDNLDGKIRVKTEVKACHLYLAEYNTLCTGE